MIKCSKEFEEHQASVKFRFINVRFRHLSSVFYLDEILSAISNLSLELHVPNSYIIEITY